MVARDIRKPGHRGIRGYFPSRKTGRSVAFESRLERDHFLLLEADPDVVRFEEQPVTIRFEGRGGSRRYTPDCKVEYRAQPTMLVEVKYAHDIASMSSDERVAMEEAHDTAKAWCSERGWCFSLLTDEEIVGPRLERAHALRAFARPPTPTTVSSVEVIAFVRARARVTIGAILDAFGAPPRLRELVLHLLWRGELRDLGTGAPTLATEVFVEVTP